MPTKDPEAKREQERRWREANRDKARASAKRYREAHKELVAERQRRYYQANKEAYRERTRRYYQADPEKAREQHRRSYQANRAKRLEYARQKRLDGYKTPRERRNGELAAKLWSAQGGRCYLCELPIPVEAAALDHDHRCHPKQNTYCSTCLRGVACMPCNTAIGSLRDDPELLERVARNLRAKLAEMDARIQSRPTQLQLIE